MTTRRHSLLLAAGLALLATCNPAPQETPQAGPPPIPGPALDSLSPGNLVPQLTAYGRQYPGHEVVIHTRHGDIGLRLYDDTPLHTANFLLLARKKFFDQTGFYRIVKDFMIQGGDDDDREMALAAYKLPPERRPEHFHRRGALAMARYGDDTNPEQLSSNHDFYIVQGHPYTDAELDAVEKETNHKFTPEQRQVYKTTGGAANLDAGYTVFGEVTSGQEVVKKIADEPVDAQKWPKQEVLMKVEVVK